MKLALVLVPVMFLSGISVAAPATLRARFTVQLDVQVSEASKESLMSDMVHELKALPDVEVTADGTALWMLMMNVVPIMDKKGLQGYVISTVISDQHASQTLKNLPSEDFTTPTAERTVKNLAAKLVDIRDQLVLTCTVNGLPKAYAQIAAYFDQNYLAPAREDIDNHNFNVSSPMRRTF